MLPPEPLSSGAVRRARTVRCGWNLGKHCPGETLLTLLSCHVKCSQPCLGKERERAKPAAHSFVLGRRKVPDPALSWLSKNQPGKVCCGKVKREIFWGIQTARRWKHRKAQAGRYLGAPSTTAGMLAWVAGRKPEEQLLSKEDKQGDGAFLETEASREQGCWFTAGGNCCEGWVTGAVFVSKHEH